MILLYSILSIYVLWIFYLAVMNLKRARDNAQLSKVALCLGFPIFLVGYAIDVLVNIGPMTIIFVEFPRETTVTARLKRHIYTSHGWREELAAWFCHHLLNPYDPSGSHCGGPK